MDIIVNTIIVVCKWSIKSERQIMAIRKIRKIGDPVLRCKSKPIDKIDRDTLNLARDMIDTLNSEGGVGLAAPQIGVSKKIIVINYGDKFEAYINPEIEFLSKSMIEGDEGCLSIYSIQFKVNRHSKVKVKTMDLKGNILKITANDFLARIFQHEIDHLNGILFLDHLDKEIKAELLQKVNEIKGGLDWT